jgi:hypothetical protein
LGCTGCSVGAPHPRKKKAPPKLVELEEESGTPSRSAKKKAIQKPK